MSKLSADRYQVWVPGKLAWELWSVNRKKQTAKLIHSVDEAADLKFKVGAGFRVLALPTTQTSAVSFYSSALNEKRLEDGAQVFLKQNQHECDIDGIGMQPIAGLPPRTLTRIDIPQQGLDGVYPEKLRPDLVVPATSLFKMPRRGIAIWNEMGRVVAAFEKNGLTQHYLSSDGVEKEEVDDFVTEVIEQAQKLTDERKIDPVGRVSLWNFRIDRSLKELGEKVEVKFSEERPEPLNLRSSIGMRPLKIREIDHEITTKRKLRNQRIALTLTSILLILVSTAIFVFTHLQKQDQIAEIDGLTEQSVAVRGMKSMWEEIAPAVDRNESILETWRKLVLTTGSDQVDVKQLAIAQHGVIMYCQAASKQSAMEYVDAIAGHDFLSKYAWDYTTPEIRADGSALFEIKGIKHSIR